MIKDTTMNGYILFRQPDGSVARFESTRASRQALRRILEDAVPEGQQVLGLVFGPQEQTHLRPLRLAS